MDIKRQLCSKAVARASEYWHDLRDDRTNGCIARPGDYGPQIAQGTAIQRSARQSRIAARRHRKCSIGAARISFHIKANALGRQRRCTEAATIHHKREVSSADASIEFQPPRDILVITST